MSLRMRTRSALQMCTKWYECLAPTMKEKGEWGAGDDDALLAALQTCGACEETEVSWGDLLRGRTASACLRRWKVMQRWVPAWAEEGFQGCVEKLAAMRAAQLAKKAQKAAEAHAEEEERNEVGE